MSPSLHPGFSSPARAPQGAIEGAAELGSVGVTASLGMGRVGVAQGNDGESGETADECAPPVSSAKFTRRAFFVRLGEVRAQRSFLRFVRAEER